ncbi:MAG: DUF2147 domain-containing protein [Pseudomonadota bacterium]
MPFLPRMLIAAAVLVAAPALAKAPAGIWQNPKGTVRVVFRDCAPAGAICGRILWASAEAQAKTDAAGGGRLVGRDLFQQFVPVGPGEWEGSVLIPDVGQSVQGTIRQTGPKTLVGEGCLFGAFGCKQQVWVRIDRGK